MEGAGRRVRPTPNTKWRKSWMAPGSARRLATVAAAVSALALVPTLAHAADPTDTKSEFGFTAPVAKAATGTFDGPGDTAITVADGLSVKLVSDNVAEF